MTIKERRELHKKVVSNPVSLWTFTRRYYHLWRDWDKCINTPNQWRWGSRNSKGIKDNWRKDSLNMTYNWYRHRIKRGYWELIGLVPKWVKREFYLQNRDE